MEIVSTSPPDRYAALAKASHSTSNRSWAMWTTAGVFGTYSNLSIWRPYTLDWGPVRNEGDE